MNRTTKKALYCCCVLFCCVSLTKADTAKDSDVSGDNAVWGGADGNLYLYNVPSGEESIIASSSYISYPRINGSNVVYTASDGVRLYNIDSKQNILISDYYGHGLTIDNDNIVWYDHNPDPSRLYSYKISSGIKTTLQTGETDKWNYHPDVDKDRLVWEQRDSRYGQSSAEILWGRQGDYFNSIEDGLFCYDIQTEEYLQLSDNFAHAAIDGDIAVWNETVWGGNGITGYNFSTAEYFNINDEIFTFGFGSRINIDGNIITWIGDGQGAWIYDLSTEQVLRIPEPTTLLLFGLGTLAIRKRRI